MVSTDSSAAEGEAAARPDAAPRFARRLDGLDLLRGLVMVLMALDHARDFFSPTMGPRGMMAPELLPDPGPALFFTRWVTHFCAPVFVFLAGASAFLYGHRGRSPQQVSRFLLTRGLWLVVLEFSVVTFGWMFVAPLFLGGLGVVIGQVIWAIGVSMIVLAGLIHLPRLAVTAIGLALVAGHNLLDGSAIELSVQHANPYALDGLQRTWQVLHASGFMPIGETGSGFVAAYPLVPWIGVMALGWAFGPLLLAQASRRRSVCLGLGLTAIAAFVVLRLANGYGDPWPWEQQATGTATLIDFLNCQKYPPSLLFLLMTLGPALALLPLYERLASTTWGRPLTTIGKVPLLYYLAHIYLLNLASKLWAVARFGSDAWSWGLMGGYSADYNLGLWTAYVAWALSVLALYPLCRWFAGVKARNRSPWLSYL